MTKQLQSSIDIDATPSRVWAVLADFAAYPDWNPFIVSASGAPEVGKRLTLRMQPTRGRGVTLRPTVLEAEAGRALRWLGRLGVRGLFDAEHRFTLEEREDGRTRLSQTEDFSGALVPLMSRSLDRGTLPAFQAMNEALKARAEAPAGAEAPARAEAVAGGGLARVAARPAAGAPG